ncbi:MULTISPECIES: MFS transporter [unclassified Pseudomonas]|uniref:MFS transporter n=1 Tax=unclassified Pseudomonas TaxID=196821 RepID=UPI00211EB16C|nr:MULTISPECIES: MFS transporter [unclassified Pseudomonas]
MNTINLHAVAATSTFNRFHAQTLAWCVLISVIDGYDLAITGAALPAIMNDMSVDAKMAGFMASSALFGTMLGAIFLGASADRIGRPKVIAFCIVLFSVFTAAAGLAEGPILFSVCRFISGLGIGGVLPICAAQVAEFSPARLRTRLITIVFAGYSVGGILVALTSKALIEKYGWQTVFFSSIVPLILSPLVLRKMPDSIA